MLKHNVMLMDWSVDQEILKQGREFDGCEAEVLDSTNSGRTDIYFRLLWAFITARAS